MNNSSLLTADRATHLRIVVVSLLCAMLVAGVAVANRMNAASGASEVQASVIKAARPLTAATTGESTIR
jgi:hypothetical protein